MAIGSSAPTGHSAVDLVERVLLGVTVALIGMAASPVMLVVAPGIVGMLTIGRPLVGLPMLALAAGAAIVGARRPALPRWLAALAAGGTAAGALWIPSLGGFGRSALVAGVLDAALLVGGFLGHGPTARRTARRAGLAVAGVTLVAIAGSVVGFLSARSHSRSAQDALFDTTIAANQGELALAATALSQAQDSLVDLDESLNAPWSRLADVLPVVSQHRRLALDLAEQAGTTVDVAAKALAVTDLERLKVERQRVDLDRVAAMETPIVALASAVDQLRGQFASPRSGWIIGRVRSGLDETADELTTQSTRARNLAATVRLAPAMLGSSGPRRILIAFLTPAEARPLGGHMANYGELTIDNGRIEMTEFGRSSDLVEASADPATRVITGPESYLTRYGPFGAGGGGTPAGEDWWLDVTISPDFPSVAQVISEMYANATGRTVDEVMAIDPKGLAALLEITGPIPSRKLGQDLTAENVVDLLTKTQYRLFGKEEKDDRVEFLGDAGKATFDALLGRQRLDPIVLVKHLAEPASGGHVMLWSRHADEQELFRTIHIDGAFDRPERADALALTTLNSGANKTDAFLQRTIRYDAIVDETSGKLTATVEVTLRNDSPTDGLPFRVIGNSVDEPFGTNRTYLTLYGAGAVTKMSVDGVATEPAIGTELGWTFAERRLSLAPGSTTRIEYDLTGQLPLGEPYRLFVRAQPLVNDDLIDVQVHNTAGQVLASYSGVVDRDMVIDSLG